VPGSLFFHKPYLFAEVLQACRTLADSPRGRDRSYGEQQKPGSRSPEGTSGVG
jgi:hypothetical protein